MPIFLNQNLRVQYQKSRSRSTLLTDFFETRNYESSAFPSLKLFNAQSGGSIIRTTKALSLHGNAWNVMKLVDPHTFDEFSRLRLDITISVEVDFVICGLLSGFQDALLLLSGLAGSGLRTIMLARYCPTNPSASPSVRVIS